VQDCALPYPCKVEYYEPKFEISDAHHVYPEFEDRFILYRDEYVATIYKPAKLSSMPAKEQRRYSVKAAIERILHCTIHMPSRLDVSVSGIMVVSLSPESHRSLQQQFEHREITKEYLLASDVRHDQAEWSIDAPIANDSQHPVLRTVSREYGQTAQTNFIYRGSSFATGLSVYSAFPVTGRTHQIRVHATHSGIPIVGDRFYGGSQSETLHLISYRITFRHPISLNQCSFQLPEEFVPTWATDFPSPL